MKVARMKLWAVALGCVACGEAPDRAADPVPRGVMPMSIGATPPAVRQYRAGRTPDSVVVDGQLTEVTWQSASWSEPFVDILGDRGAQPQWTTRVALAWDDQALYIAARLEEPHLWATITQHDAVIFQDNDFEVFLDPDGDTHRYYELEINALGTVWDLFLDRPYRDGGRALDEWDIDGLRSAVALSGTLNDPADVDSGWTVELALPWIGLRQPGGPVERRPEDGDNWRVNFSRVEWELTPGSMGYAKTTMPDGSLLPEKNWVWSPQDAINMHMPEMWGMVEFRDAVAGSEEAGLRPMEDEAVRWSLRRVYYAQRQYHDIHGKFAATLEDLGLGDLDITLVTQGDTATSYRATGLGMSTQWNIDHTGRLVPAPGGE